MSVENSGSKKTSIVTVEMDLEKIQKDSVIYMYKDAKNPISSYQRSINDASLKLCLDDPSLLKERGRLIALAREQVHNEGYQYKKKKSRSKAFGNTANQAKDSPA